MKRSAFLIGLFGATGVAALWVSYGSMPDWVSWKQIPVVVLAVALQSVSVDLFTYHHKTPGVVAPSERRALTAGLAGTFLVLGLYGTEVAVFTAVIQAIASALLIRSPWYKAVFNTGLYTTATFLAGWVYHHLG